MTKNLRLGIDVGGTNASFGIVNSDGEILIKGSISSKGHQTPIVFVDELYKEILGKSGVDFFERIKSIGVGAPSGNFYTGNIEFAPNIEWEGIIPLAKLIEEKFLIPTKLTNDANAAAMGEMMFGAAKEMKDFIMVTLGTGVGSGFVANGKLIYGHDGFAGELGHVVAVRGGRACGCGRKGCLETYTSATGIVRTAYEFLEKKSMKSSLESLEKITSKDLFEAAQNGDLLALEIFNFTGEILGQTLADAAAITSPEAIILFGGLAQAGHYIFAPTQKYFEENLLMIYKNKINIIPSLLNENDAAILGAAAL
ncbi:MAG: ROK family protein [Bacteroidetes bacterium OLB11]|nr:MAG: ROK family protein [Bacteroidetes bacterium OLB11]